MIVKKELLQTFLGKYKIDAEVLASDIGIDTSEVEKLLNGERVDENTTRKFIYYFGVYEAARLIDWDAIGKTNPFGIGD